MTRVYKILARPLWEAAKRAGVFQGAAIDLKDGYIHLSTAAQAAETARLHFAGQRDLVLLALDAGSLGAAGRCFPTSMERSMRRRWWISASFPSTPTAGWTRASWRREPAA